jgi:hypothetical protein
MKLGHKEEFYRADEGRILGSEEWVAETKNRIGEIPRGARPLLGGEKMAGKDAIIEVKRGKGRVIMFAFRPQYRGQSIATLPFLFNAISTSTASR